MIWNEKRIFSVNDFEKKNKNSFPNANAVEEDKKDRQTLRLWRRSLKFCYVNDAPKKEALYIIQKEKKGKELRRKYKRKILRKL